MEVVELDGEMPGELLRLVLSSVHSTCSEHGLAKLISLLFLLPACLGLASSSDGLGDSNVNISRVVFSLTTIPSRIALIEPVLDALVKTQTYELDVVYLAVPPSLDRDGEANGHIDLPLWLQDYNQKYMNYMQQAGKTAKTTLEVLHMESDYGPASKLLAAIREGGERDTGTLIVYGDDDILYPPTLVEQHVHAQTQSRPNQRVPTTFGTRRISIGKGSLKETMLEATGSISVVASDVPSPALDDPTDIDIFRVGSMPAVCRLSDDYWIAHHLAAAGLAFELLPTCHYDFNINAWASSCGSPFHAIATIEHIDSLSATTIAKDGHVLATSGGDWRAQLKRYQDCQTLLLQKDLPDMPRVPRTTDQNKNTKLRSKQTKRDGHQRPKLGRAHFPKPSLTQKTKN